MKRKISPLLAKAVRVYPDLTTDPAGKQGKIGIVIPSFQSEEVIRVEFSDGVKGDYMPDALQVLYPKEVIQQGLTSNPDISTEDQDIITAVHQLMAEDEVVALKLANSNDTTRFFCTTNCMNWLEMVRRKEVVAYIRTDTTDATNKTRELQESKIRDYCRQNNLHIQHIFIDSSAGGNNVDRKSWNTLVSYLQQNKGTIDYLVVANYDRIARNMTLRLQEMKKVKAHGVAIRMAGEPLKRKHKKKPGLGI